MISSDKQLTTLYICSCSPAFFKDISKLMFLINPPFSLVISERLANALPLCCLRVPAALGHSTIALFCRAHLNGKGFELACAKPAGSACLSLRSFHQVYRA
jgi:hypothetical protein